MKPEDVARIFGSEDYKIAADRGLSLPVIIACIARAKEVKEHELQWTRAGKVRARKHPSYTVFARVSLPSLPTHVELARARPKSRFLFTLCVCFAGYSVAS